MHVDDFADMLDRAEEFRLLWKRRQADPESVSDDDLFAARDRAWQAFSDVVREIVVPMLDTPEAP